MNKKIYMNYLHIYAVIFAIVYIVVSVSAFGVTYAKVGDYSVTSDDIAATLGSVPTSKDKRDRAIDDMVERFAVLCVAEKKGISVTSDEIDRAISLTKKARGINTVISVQAYREYVRQELVISEYIDEYVYNRVDIDEEKLFLFFALAPNKFVKHPPQGKSALKKAFPKYRNAILHQYIILRVGELLREDIDKANIIIKFIH